MAVGETNEKEKDLHIIYININDRDLLLGR